MTAFADLGPTIETDRLLLRVQRAEDFELFAELLGDEEACRYIGGTLTRAAAWRKFLQMPGAWAVQGFGMFAVIEKSSGDWLGNIGPWKPVGWPGNEVGWALRRAAWGKGYATEAAVAAIDWAFANLGWDEVRFPKPLFHGDTIRVESEVNAGTRCTWKSSFACRRTRPASRKPR